MTTVLNRSSRMEWAALALFIAACLLVGGIGGYVNASAIPGWYAGLRKPSWTPPNEVFGPVWTFLYIGIGLAGWLVWRADAGARRSRALRLWGAQLALNFIWTPLFFGLQSPASGAAVIVLLWAAIGAFIPLAWRISLGASILFAPYWVWVSYATALNFAILWLNRN